jgi:DNA polymerase-3 subunit alpha
LVRLPVMAGQHWRRHAQTGLRRSFGDRFYIELQRHGLGIERTAEPHLLEIADRLNLPIVATNDCRFEDAAMSQPHDTLVCIGTGRKFSETNRPRFSPEHYFKTAVPNV